MEWTKKWKRRMISLVTAYVMCAVLAVCPLEVSALTPLVKEYTMDIGETMTLYANVSSYDVESGSGHWTSNSPSVQVVSQSSYTHSCTIKAVKSTGSLTAYVEYRFSYKMSSGMSATGMEGRSRIKVLPPSPTSVSLSSANLSLKVGGSAQLKATVYPSDSDQTCSYSSSDPSVAGVTDSGKVVAKGEGTARITAKTVNGKTASCTVTVSSTAGGVQEEEPQIIKCVSFGGGGNDRFNDVVEAKDGFVAAGYSGVSSFGNGDWSFAAGKGGDDAIIVKYDKEGEIQWKKNYGAAQNDAYKAVTAVENCYVAVGNKGNNAVAVKYDEAGSIVWEKEEEGCFNGVAAAENGCCVAVGKKGINAIIVKYDAMGNELWRDSLPSNKYTCGYMAIVAVNDGYVVVGECGYNPIIRKYSTSGRRMWVESYDDQWLGNQYQTITAVKDGYVVSGIVGSLHDSVTVKYSRSGTQIWERDFPYKDLTAEEEGFAAVWRFGVAKHDLDGNAIWENDLEGNNSNSDKASFTSLTTLGDDYIAAGYAESNCFGIGALAELKGKGSSDAVLIIYGKKAPEPDYTPTGITLSSSSLSMKPGEQIRLAYTLSPSQAAADVSFASSDPSVASVDSNGQITAVGAGTATITARTSNGKTAACTVTVTAAATAEFSYQVLADGTLAITGYNGSAEDVVIPDAIENKKVTVIGDFAFNIDSKLRSIELPKSLECIGKYAFRGCGSLKSVKVPSKVTSINDCAFLGCGSLKSIKLPEGLTSIGEYAFQGCSSLESIELPESLDSIGKAAISRCGSLKSVKVPSKVARLEEDVFWECSSLESVELPESLTFIGRAAFFDCGNLRQVSYAGSRSQWLGITMENQNECLTNAMIYYKVAENGKPDDPAGNSDFTYDVLADGTLSLTNYEGKAANVTIPSAIDGRKVTQIGERAFSDSNLTSVTLPQSIIKIGAEAFVYCDALESIKLPDSVTEIGSHAFAGCNALGSIKMSPNLKEIGEYGFAWCRSLESIKLPDGVTKIKECTFYGCNNLKSIELPDSVTEIGKLAFAGIDCKNIKLPKKLKIIDNGAFAQCDSLKGIELPDSVIRLGDYAFEYSSLTSIKLSGSLQSINPRVFYNCSSLKSIELPRNIKIIGDYAFEACFKLENIKILGNVTKIGAGAFRDCRNLKSIKLPKSVKEIGQDAFEEAGLKDVYYEGSRSLWNKRKMDGAFDLWEVNIHCSGDAPGRGSSLKLGGSTYKVTKVKSEVSLIGVSGGKTSVTVPKTVKIDGITYKVTSIGANAFLNQKKLSRVTIGENVASIGNQAFSGCRKLQSVTLGSGVRKIGREAFIKCPKLKTITIKSTKLKSVGKNAFKGINAKARIKVPSRKLAAYKRLMKGKGQGRKVKIVRR